MTIKISGTGRALPEHKVTNQKLQELVETSDEWIRERTGIGERRISTGDTVVSLAAEACRKALEMAGKAASEVELILVATCSPEYLLPCCACQVQSIIGAVHGAAFDLNAACAGFLFGLDTAYAYLQSGLYKNALIVGSEVLSKLVDCIQAALEKAGLTVEDIDLFLLHQANERIIRSVAKRLKADLSKFPMNLQRVGNMSSATIPVLLDELNRDGRIQKGDRLVLSGFGAGLTYGATVLVWG